MAKKRLYTESDVAALPRGAVLVLGKEALATPSALDLAHARGVQVRYGDAKPSEGATGSGAETWGKLLAQDGTYVVTVKAGAAIVTRLVDGVPVPFSVVPAPPATK